MGKSINWDKPSELNVESNVYNPSKGPNIPCLVIEAWLVWSVNGCPTDRAK